MPDYDKRDYDEHSDFLPDFSDDEWEGAKNCDRCGCGPLWWNDEITGGRSWVLVDDAGNQHFCPANDEGFEVLT